MVFFEQVQIAPVNAVAVGESLFAPDYLFGDKQGEGFKEAVNDYLAVGDLHIRERLIAEFI